MTKKFAIGIDLGGTHLRVAIVSRDGDVVKKIKEPTSEEILDSIFRSVSSLFSDEVAGIGLGIAGLIDREGSNVLISPNIPSIKGLDLVSEINGRFRVPVFIENDANVAAFGENWVGAGKEFSSFFLFTLGTGIGGGIIQDKELLNVAAEVGHMTINANGNKCHCGNSGCLESYASANAILLKVVAALEEGRESMLTEFRSGNFYKITPEDIYRAALDGDIFSREILKDAGKYLGIGVANVINLMSPDAIIFTGGLTGAWDIYIQEAIKEASKRAFKELFDKVKILPSLLRADAGIIGSAGLVFHSESFEALSQ